MTQQLEKEIHETLDNISVRNTEEDENLQATCESIKAVVKRNSSLYMIEDFMNTFDQTIASKPSFPDKATQELRFSLMLEELLEFAEACGPDLFGFAQRLLFKKSQDIHYIIENKRETLVPDLVKVLDAFTDKRYVNDGTIISFGMQHLFDEAFLEVHNSNMSKACNNKNEVIDTLDKYKGEGIKVLAIEKGDKTLILREGDKKVLKSINYRPAQLDKFIHKSL